MLQKGLLGRDHFVKDSYKADCGHRFCKECYEIIQTRLALAVRFESAHQYQFHKKCPITIQLLLNSFLQFFTDFQLSRARSLPLTQFEALIRGLIKELEWLCKVIAHESCKRIYIFSQSCQVVNF